MLSHEEYERSLEIVRSAKGRVLVLAGAGSNNTSEAIRLGPFVARWGRRRVADHPYYNKPTQEGLYSHFRRHCRDSGSAWCLATCRAARGCNMPPPVLEPPGPRLFQHRGRWRAYRRYAGQLKTLEACLESFSVLSGDDLTAPPLLGFRHRYGRRAPPPIDMSLPASGHWKAIPFRPRRPVDGKPGPRCPASHLVGRNAVKMAKCDLRDPPSGMPGPSSTTRKKRRSKFTSRRGSDAR